MLKSLRMRSPLAAALALAAMGSASASAPVQQFLWNSAPATGGHLASHVHYVDFQASSPGRDYPTWTPPAPAGAGTLKYAYFSYYTNTSASGNECYEVSTYKGGAVTNNADVRLWIYDPNTITTRHLSDDYNGSASPRARIWAKSNQVLSFTVSPYNSLSATIDFTFWVRRVNYTSASACQTQGLPTNANPMHGFLNTTVTPWIIQ